MERSSYLAARWQCRETLGIEIQPTLVALVDEVID